MLILHYTLLPELRNLLLTELAQVGFNEVHVGRKVPTERKPLMVILRNNGGPQVNLIQNDSIVSASIWATNDDEADQLAAYVVAIIRSAAERNDTFINTVRCTVTPQDVTDPAIGVPQRFTQFQIRHQAGVIQ